MIKANELRIGNLISVRHPEGATDNIQLSFIDGEDNEDIDPIPLTPEILEKAGFINSQNFITSKSYSYGDNEITSDWLIEIRWTKTHGFFFQNARHQIQHVHQLQNLFFALCGEELNINL